MIFSTSELKHLLKQDDRLQPMSKRKLKAERMRGSLTNGNVLADRELNTSSKMSISADVVSGTSTGSIAESRADNHSAL